MVRVLGHDRNEFGEGAVSRRHTAVHRLPGAVISVAWVILLTGLLLGLGPTLGLL